MLENIIYFSPLGALLIGILSLWSANYGEYEIYKCFRRGRVFLYISMALGIIFYNKPLLPEITAAAGVLTMFRLMLYAGALAVLFLPRSWFSAMGISGLRYCIFVLFAVFIGSLMITSTNLVLTIVCAFIMMVENFCLLCFDRNKNEMQPIDIIYLATVVVLAVFSSAALLEIAQISPTMSYGSIRQALVANIVQPEVYAAVIVLLIDFVFLSGLAPMHFWLAEGTAKSGLPVLSYLILVPAGMCLACLTRINSEILADVPEYFTLFYKLTALISITIGAIGACSSHNVRKIFTYTTVLQMGIVLLILQKFTIEAYAAACVYSIIYLLPMYGLCSAMFGLKVRGEYLFKLTDFAGVAMKKPFMALMIMLYLFSLIGFPFTLGFIGMFSVLQELMGEPMNYTALYLLLMLLLLSYGFWQLISAMYTANNKIVFDKTDIGIYMMTALGILLSGLMLSDIDYWYFQMTELWKTAAL